MTRVEKQPDATPVDATPVDATPVDATPVDATPVDATPAAVVPVDAQPVGATPVAASPLGAEPADVKPVAAPPAVTTPAGREPVDGELVDAVAAGATAVGVPDADTGAERGETVDAELVELDVVDAEPAGSTPPADDDIADAELIDEPAAGGAGMAAGVPDGGTPTPPSSAPAPPVAPVRPADVSRWLPAVPVYEPPPTERSDDGYYFAPSRAADTVPFVPPAGFDEPWRGSEPAVPAGAADTGPVNRTADLTDFGPTVDLIARLGISRTPPAAPTSPAARQQPTWSPANTAHTGTADQERRPFSPPRRPPAWDEEYGAPLPRRTPIEPPAAAPPPLPRRRPAPESQPASYGDPLPRRTPSAEPPAPFHLPSIPPAAAQPTPPPQAAGASASPGLPGPPPPRLPAVFRPEPPPRRPADLADHLRESRPADLGQYSATPRVPKPRRSTLQRPATLADLGRQPAEEDTAPGPGGDAAG